MIFIERAPGRSVGRLREQGDRTRTPDGTGQLPLVAGAAPRDTPRRDFAPLGDEPSQPADVLEIDETQLVHAELADLATAEAPPLDGLACGWNGVVLLIIGVG